MGKMEMVGNTRLVRKESVSDLVENVYDVVSALYMLVHSEGRAKGKGMPWRYREYERIAPILLEKVFADQKLIEMYRKREVEMDGREAENSRARWSEEEDEYLISAVTGTDGYEKSTVAGIAVDLGRTPGAVQSRLSHLVGVKRLSQEVVGTFVGDVGGERRSVRIDGTLYRDGGAK